MTTYIHPDNPFFGGMEQIALMLIIGGLIMMLAILIVIALVIKVVFTAIFGKSDDEERIEERIDNDIVKTEEASEQEVVENSAQSRDDAQSSGQNQI